MAEANLPFPEIRIKSSWQLTERMMQLLPRELPETQLPIAETHDRIDEVIERYRAPWEPRENQIIPGICRLMNLTFRQNVIDAYIVPGANAISDPIMIAPDYPPDYFPDILTHELLHKLLTDNTTYQDDPTLMLGRWRELFGSHHSFQTLVHIPVHAGLAAVYTDVLDEPHRLQRDMNYGKVLPGYGEAWNYVSEHGYQHILGQLAAMHETLARNNGG